ncbi:MAG: alpha/beta hydrolase [Pyrinomonadaceae bacterium]
MKRFATLALLLLCPVAFHQVADAQNVRAGQLVVEPYTLQTYDGRDHAAEFGRLWVRENRAARSDRLIQLAFVRLKSTARQPASPIVWLAGGPGVPGIGMAKVPVYYSLFERLREVADVILLDQRGTGMSTPNLECQHAPLPADAFETDAKWLRAYTDLSRACAERWRAQEVDLAAYTNDASADDVDELRQALGTERVSLVGHSYGTILAQAMLRRHAARVERVALANTEGADNLVTLPSVWDTLIKKLSYFAGEDQTVGKLVPDMEALYRRVLDKLERNPLTLTVTDERAKRPVQIRVGKIGLQWLVRLDMSDARTYALLPALLLTIDQGDYSVFAKQFKPLFNDFGARSPMANVMDCSLGWSAERWARAQKETPRALFSNVNLQWTSGVCQSLGVAERQGESSRPRLWSTVPTLFISGTLDTNTPPFEAEEVRWGFPNSTHLVVENGGHETLPSEQVQSVVLDFFKGQDVSPRRVVFARPRFLSVEELKSMAAGTR